MRISPLGGMVCQIDIKIVRISHQFVQVDLHSLWSVISSISFSLSTVRILRPSVQAIFSNRKEATSFDSYIESECQTCHEISTLVQINNLFTITEIQGCFSMSTPSRFTWTCDFNHCGVKVVVIILCVPGNPDSNEIERASNIQWEYRKYGEGCHSNISTYKILELLVYMVKLFSTDFTGQCWHFVLGTHSDGCNHLKGVFTLGNVP